MMKRFISFFVLIAVFVLTRESLALLKVGIKGGVNLGNVAVSGSDRDYKIKPGFMLGVFGEIPLTPSGQLGLRGDLLYVRKGTQYEVVGNEVTWNMDEIVAAPFLLFRFPVPRLNPFLQAGPEVGFNTLAQTQVNGDKADVGPGWKATNISLNFGAGATLPLGLNDLIFDFRYNLGLSDLNDGLAVSSSKIKTHGIQLLMGLAFFRI